MMDEMQRESDDRYQYDLDEQYAEEENERRRAQAIAEGRNPDAGFMICCLIVWTPFILVLGLVVLSVYALYKLSKWLIVTLAKAAYKKLKPV